jgi:hypothetical protein
MLSPSMVVVLLYLLVWRIGIWGYGNGTVFGGFQQFGALSSGLQKPIVSHRTQIYGPVRGATM